VNIVMKNYYKILGVKKNAPEEEIREHWVRLMRKLHPDQPREGAVGDERIREVNEAYQVLKYPSTRMEYDLKMAYDQKKRGSYFQRLSVPVSILIVLFILGTVYHKKTQITIQPVSVTQGKINQIDQKNQINRRNQINQTDQINERNQINLSRLPRSESVRGEMRSLFHRDQTDPINQTNQMNEKDQRNQMNQINPIASTAQRRFDEYTHPRIEPIDSTTQLTQGHNDPMDQNIQLMQRRDDPINANMQLTQQPNGLITAVNQTDQINERNQINLSRLPRSESVRGEMRSLFHWD
jgi:curved DNA-binding protein CbpA